MSEQCTHQQATAHDVAQYMLLLLALVTFYNHEQIN